MTVKEQIALYELDLKQSNLSPQYRIELSQRLQHQKALDEYGIENPFISPALLEEFKRQDKSKETTFAVSVL